MKAQNYGTDLARDVSFPALVAEEVSALQSGENPSLEADLAVVRLQ